MQDVAAPISTSVTDVAAKLAGVRRSITKAALGAGRESHQITLVAVSKTRGVPELMHAITAGQNFGENYIQEALSKIIALYACCIRPSLVWHCIGPIQSNKSQLVATHFDWVHTVDRLKIAQRLSDQRPAHLQPLQVCIQVNIDHGPHKSGVMPQDALELARAVAVLPRLRLRGLMAIPEPALNPAAARQVHQRLADLMAQLNAQGLALDTLSMGMSDDLVSAIEAGSTMVRVGTAIFGSRPAKTE